MLINLKTQIQPPIVIVGLGKSGQSAKDLLLASGFSSAEIITFDEKSSTADYNSKQRTKADIAPKTLIVSPGFPLKDDLIQFWRAQGALVTSEINLATYFLSTEKIVGITGALGKSTTTSLIGAGLISIDKNAFIGGNLGTPFCEYALRVLKNSQARAQWIALELSSYQLENSAQLSLDYSIITYLTPNHLERYKDLQDYYQTKWSIFNQTKHKILLNENGGDLKSFAHSKDLSKALWIHPKSEKLEKFEIEKSVILGKHNIDNVALAVSFILEAGLPASCIQAIKQFQGLNHRLEIVKKTSENILFINDSKATTIDSVLTAVESCVDKPDFNKILLLIGGKDKKLPWLTLKDKISNPKIEILFFGESGLDIRKTLDLQHPYYKTLKELLSDLKKYLSPNTIVLLSPGGTSHDEFKNFEERGEVFKSWVVGHYSP